MNKLIKKTTIGVIGLVMVLSMVSVVTITDRAEAADPTVTELLVIIATLNETIARLNATIDEFHADRAIVPDAWCHDFRRNLRIGDRGAEVRALQTALEKENFDINAAEQNVARFGSHTAAAVTGFQEKYREAILVPWGLPRGTGFVGPTTRTKLNELFGCDVVRPPVRPSITVLSPNGGEQWEVGERRTIRWRAKGIERVVINLHHRVPGYAEYHTVALATNVNAAQGTYRWRLSQAFFNRFNIRPGDEFKIMIADAADDPVGIRAIDKSDNYFSIIKQAVMPSITVISPNGGERWEVGGTYEIKWNAEGIERLDISICSDKTIPVGGCLVVGRKVDADMGKHSLYIDSAEFKPTDDVKIWILSMERAEGRVEDMSDNYFSIVSPAAMLPITVTSPDPNQTITNPVRVSGKSDTFEANVRIRIKDDNNKILADTFTVGGTMRRLEPFSRDVFYIKPSAPRGIVEVFEDCQRTREELNKVSVPIIFGPYEIIDSSIIVLSPNGGERLRQGGTHIIKWDAFGMDPREKVNIHLWAWTTEGRKLTARIAMNVPANKESHLWRVSGLFPGLAEEIQKDRFKIFVATQQDPRPPIVGAGDKSDNYFSIIERVVTPSIIVTSPNGGERWAIRNRYDITWRSVGDIGMVDIVLVDHRAGPRETVIAKNISANVNRYSWTIPIGITPGDTAFTISIRGKAIDDASDNYFSIARRVDLGLWAWNFCTPDRPCTVGQGDCDRDADCAPGLFCAQNVGAKYGQASSMDVCERKVGVRPSITVISPKEGEQLVRGQTYEIRWEAEGVNYVKITLYNKWHRAYSRVIASRVPNTGVFRWAIPFDPQSILPTRGFKIGITAVVPRNGIGGDSGLFDIARKAEEIKPSITVLSPNGGEQWVRGQTYQIKWNSVDIPGNIYIGIYQVGQGGERLGGSPIVEGVSARLGFYNWKIPFTRREHERSNWRIVISQPLDEVPRGESPASDESDRYFSLVRPGVAPCRTDRDCEWCGNKCLRRDYKGDRICPTVMPPKNYECVCRDGRCRAVKKVVGPVFWDWNFCAPDRLCSVGQGDCDRDADCAAGLFCAQNVGAKYGQASSMDVCERKVEVRPSIIVTSPNGGERWETGKTHEIRWTTRNIPSGSEVTIWLHDYLRQDPSGYPRGIAIARGLSYDLGRYRWTISKATEEGNRYKIGIEVGLRRDGRIIYDGEASDKSNNYFSIVKPVVACTDSDKGIDFFTKGWVQDSYDRRRFYDHCTLDGREVSSCIDPNLNCGIIERHCINNRRAGRFLSGAAFDAKCPYGCKDGACVKKEKSITVLSPNGGERWEEGEIYKITWEHNLTGNFEAWIDLLKGGTYYGPIAGGDVRLSDAQNLMSYSWRVGDMKGGVGEGNDYQIRITYNNVDIPGGMFTDTSDNYFSIALIDEKAYKCPDIDNSGLVDIFDTVIISARFGACHGDANYDIRGDVNRDNCLTQADLAFVSKYLNQRADQILQCQAVVAGLGNIENQIASVSEAVRRLMENMRKFLER